MPRESIDTWRLRLKSQEHIYPPMISVGITPGVPMEQVDPATVPGHSLPSELLQLMKESRATLEEIQELTARTSDGFGTMPEVEVLSELYGLVKMAKHLEEMVVRNLKTSTTSKIVDIVTRQNPLVSFAGESLQQEPYSVFVV